MSIEYQREILAKIKRKESLSKEELRDIIFEYDIHTEKGSDGRWYRHMSTVSKLDDTYVVTNWQCGLTEYQENEYDEEPAIVTEVKTEEIKIYRHTICLDDDTTLVVTNHKLEFMKE